MARKVQESAAAAEMGVVRLRQEGRGLADQSVRQLTQRGGWGLRLRLRLLFAVARFDDVSDCLVHGSGCIVIARLLDVVEQRTDDDLAVLAPQSADERGGLR